MKAIIFLAIIGLIAADEQWHEPNPISRVSGKSFIPNKMMQQELLRTTANVYPYALGGPKTMIQTKTLDLTADLCPVCIQVADETLNFLLNAVLNLGIVGSCQILCTYVGESYGKLAEAVCTLLCDGVGIDEFIKIIEKADLDPIYYCELLKACPIFDQGDATITSFTVNPNKGPQGTFMIDARWESINGTGTGELYIGIKTVDGVPIEDGFLMEPQKPGKYTTQIKLNAVPDPDCDPTAGECENWLPGIYKAEIAICNGQCGSAHPHSKIYTQAVANFTITN